MRLSTVRWALFGVFLLSASSWTSVNAAGASGVWKSTSGNTIIIPDNPKAFDVVVMSTNGKVLHMGGSWSPGLTGSQFTYTYGNQQNVCVFTTGNPNQIICHSSNGRSVWNRTHTTTRYRVENGTPLEHSTLAGIWRSTSGSTVIIPANPHALHVIVMAPSGTRTLYVARWISTKGVKQFAYSVPNQPDWVATVQAGNPNLISVRNRNGAGSNWTRQQVTKYTAVRQSPQVVQPPVVRPPVVRPPVVAPPVVRPPVVNQPSTNVPQQTIRTGKGSYAVAGVWMSSGGSKFVIPADPDDLDIVLTSSKGEKRLFRGHWVEGKVGVQFYYRGEQRVRICTIDTNNPNRIYVANRSGTGRKAVWTRKIQSVPRQLR